MADITGQDVLDAYNQAMDSTVDRASIELGKLIHEISYHSLGRMAGQTTSYRSGDTIQSAANTFYWKWWLNGRGPVRPKSAKSLRFFVGGKIVFSQYSKPFKGHRDELEPKYEQAVTKTLDEQLTRFFGNL